MQTVTLNSDWLTGPTKLSYLMASEKYMFSYELEESTKVLLHQMRGEFIKHDLKVKFPASLAV